MYITEGICFLKNCCRNIHFLIFLLEKNRELQDSLAHSKAFSRSTENLKVLAHPMSKCKTAHIELAAIGESSELSPPSGPRCKQQSSESTPMRKNPSKKQSLPSKSPNSVEANVSAAIRHNENESRTDKQNKEDENINSESSNQSENHNHTENHLNHEQHAHKSEGGSRGHLRKKLPPDAEAANVLVGELANIERVLVAFIRFQTPLELEGLCELKAPTRFLFVLIGPEKLAAQQHLIGRAMGTLLSDEVSLSIIVYTCFFPYFLSRK